MRRCVRVCVCVSNSYYHCYDDDYYYSGLRSPEVLRHDARHNTPTDEGNAGKSSGGRNNNANSKGSRKHVLAMIAATH